MSEILQIPLADLAITATNARKDHTIDPSLVASINAVGLLYPIVVDPLAGGTWDVVDGAQRVLALRHLEGEGLITAPVSVPCVVRPNGALSDIDGLEISLHANLRTPMHPLDECEAIVRLSKSGEDENAIALRFGKDVKWLQQRVKLAGLCDEVKLAFRDGKIGLHAAMLFTIGSEAQQQAFLKRHKKFDFNIHMLNQAMTEKKVNAQYANFDLALYPPEKIQRDLFAEDKEGVWLLDRSLFLELQDVWVKEEVQRFKDQGYADVVCLEGDDWQTLNQHVQLEGKARPKTPEQRANCFVFLKMDQNGFIKVHKDMVRRKELAVGAKVDKSAKGPDKTDEAPKPLSAKQLTPAQQEIVNALACTALFNEITSGSADEKWLQWVVVSNQFYRHSWTNAGEVSSKAFAHKGTRARWGKLRETYPNEGLVADDPEFDKGLEKALDYKAFCELKPGERKKLWLHAIASMITVPGGGVTLKPNLPELEGLDWLVPGRDFFKRYRIDQLIDYRKRSGDKEAGATPKSKEDHLKDCLVISGEERAYQLGLAK